MTHQPKFEAVLRDWRTRCGYSQAQAADKLRVPKKTLQKWDQGVTEPGRWRRGPLEKRMAQVERWVMA